MASLRKITLLFVMICFNTIWGQAPKKMSYQAVIRNSSDALLSNIPVGMKVSILKGSVTGTIVYEETHTTTTNVNGLVSIEIGGGNIVSGDMGAISWGNDSYFIKTETDPTGGTNYTITGTSQLLSVPYALYAENTKPAGKSTVYLKDDITDAEAAAQIAREVGPSTEFVYITDTTLLTTVHLDAASSLIKMTVSNNSALTTLTVNGVEKTYDYIDISNNPSLTTVSFNSLINLYRIDFNNNSALQTVNFLSLKKTTISPNINDTGLNINNAALTSLNLPQLTDGHISISTCPNLTVINLPNHTNGSLVLQTTNLTSLSLPSFSNGKLSVASNPSLTSINAPNYTTSSGLTINNNIGLTSITSPNLNICNGSITITNNSVLASVNLPNLQYTPGGNITVTGNPLLTSISTPNLINSNITYSGNALTTVDFSNLNSALISITNTNMQSLSFPALVNGNFTIKNNSQLTAIAMPNLASIINGFPTTNSFIYNHLSSTSVNSILHQLTLIPSLTGKTFLLNNQLPIAPPTGQGITDKATLISQGNTVTTD